MDIGKLPNDVLKEIILNRFEIKNREVLVGPSLGEDCAAISFGDDVCVLTTDPITAATKNIGELAVNINLNDIASSGTKPLGVLITMLIPPTESIENIKRIVEEINETCIRHGVDVLGGHTEVTDAVNRIVISVTAIGKGKKDRFVKTGGAEVGDDVVLTGYAGLEGTSILAHEYEQYLKNKLDGDIIEGAKKLLKDISVVKVAEVAVEYGVTAMHDVTEGGVLGAIWEIAEASNKGIYIIKENIPILEETKKICEIFNIDPYRLISSGSMVITCKDGVGLCTKLKEKGINAEVVGKIIEYDRILESNNIIEKLTQPYLDEIYKASVKEDNI
ncbi:AIR synthase family protein [Caloramator proteoclasticus]|uniref:Hydrogenase maturation factor n=1 Tax=Caloramator proteoclasticus DSM 10124 TaxID=1121262 RepID=A0A1M4VXH3_9CLOT|nr:AIR synthase family protein [Caloramator proteoclasticus]SHE73668.1 Hydrogenase maturation factor [Caloramator proteoclasticus DSM 10124]